ncbi:bifunctional Thioredoxin domain/Thioredoxin [Babesia duncani]|uniref:protein disulfide-isomerase n=1 Tax=Babesia duncani TaxID=323732 RepID=A0AAD9PJX4_9APIC|nr:bifunctional Thioredoxin domain/Thioredoxin [Babesia duncani]
MISHYCLLLLAAATVFGGEATVTIEDAKSATLEATTGVPEVAEGDVSIPRGVVTLTADDLHKSIEKHEAIMIKFYATWCGHCKILAPEYIKAAKILEEENVNVVLAEIDAVAHSDAVAEFEIKGYPTIKFFKRGIPIDYNSDRKAETIASWCKEMLNPALMETTNLEAEIASRKSKIALVAHGCNDKDELCVLFEKLAEVHRMDAHFFSVADSSSVWFEVRHVGDGTLKFNGLSPEELALFVKDETLPLLDEINPANYARYTSSGKSISWLCANTQDYTKYRSSIVEVAKEMRSHTVFVWLDTEKFSAVNEAFAISKLPAIAHQTMKGRFILSPDAYDFTSKSAMLQFYTDVEQGKIPLSFRSEAEPQDATEGPVMLVVGKTLQQLFTQTDKAVLLMIHAPYCEHCRNFMPVFEDFAKTIDAQAPLIVAKLDGDANESPLDYVSWEAFPTVLLFKAGDKQPIPFKGTRTIEELTSFVQEHVTLAPVKTEL